MKNRIIWITGISGVGKTTLANNIKKKLKKFLKIDGDEFRKLFNNDLGYTLEDRNKNAQRIINIVEYLYKQGLDIIVSANITSPKYLRILKTKIKNLIHIHISTPIEILIKRDKKGIYKKKVNVVGLNIKFQNYKKPNLFIKNNKSKKEFLKNTKKIIGLLSLMN